ncbi:MAG: Asp-tRNA(Asn)/Glu-tRNA(Gln) amidotransferase subunit GatC [Methylococcales bacterium]|nr:Asp-tRNA(Asn)/Glu-tRNA(Gln) amidotransferase subunit GatC [Methylococcales bacterium]
MDLSIEDVKKISALARIEIEQQDIDGYVRDLGGILGLVDQLNSAETDEVTPMAHPMDQVQRLRVDQVTEQDQRELFQSQAPQVEAGLYLVPKVIE